MVKDNNYEISLANNAEQQNKPEDKQGLQVIVLCTISTCSFLLVVVCCVVSLSSINVLKVLDVLDPIAGKSKQ
jgi:hypothetical protein